jgi:hypothetical protein
MNPPHYRSAGGSHVLLNRSQDGDRILLEDRSLWKIDPSEAGRARRWPQWTKIQVKPASAHAYWLIAEVLGHRQSVLAVYGGALPLPRPGAAVSSEIHTSPTSQIGEVDI